MGFASELVKAGNVGTKLSKIGTVAKLGKYASKVKILGKKHAPEILLVTGAVVIVGSAVYACKQTLKAHEILEQANSEFDDIEKAIEASDPEHYTKADIRKDRFRVYGRTILGLAKTYGPAIIGGVIGFSMIFGAHHIIRGRNLALTAAYSTLLKQYRDYRARVIDKYGKDEEFALRSGVEERVATVVDEDGNEVEEAKVKYLPNQHSLYAKIFDECNSNWSRNPAANLKFLRGIQEYANHKLIGQGYLFLNDVYEALGMPKTSEGQIVGWVYDPKNEIDEHAGDNYVDFGIYDELYMDRAKRDFINAAEPCIWLDFNVDGVIYDLI